MTLASEQDLDLLFYKAHTHNGWLPRPVDDALLHTLYEMVRWAPTSANASPLRVVFVKSPAAKEKLRPTLSSGNVDKTMAAPVTAIVAYDTAFHDLLPELFPGRDMRSAFASLTDERRRHVAVVNGSIQGGYFILAARALGLDCGPMGGFDNAALDAAFFADGRWKSNFLVNLGYGDPAKVWPRNPRLGFDTACRIA